MKQKERGEKRRIESKHLLLVEGKDEENFFDKIF